MIRGNNPRIVALLIVTLSSVAMLAMVGCSSKRTTRTSAKTTLTQADKQAITRAIRAFESVSDPISSIRISIRVPGWARVQTEGGSDLLFKKKIDGWRIIHGAENGIGNSEKRDDGICAYGPTNVIRTLYAISCPAERALHARQATKIEHSHLTFAFRRDRLTRRYSRSMVLGRMCISRSEPSWAGAIAGAPGGGGPVWFEFTKKRWEVVYEAISNRGVHPRHSVILSLASCVGYDAGRYGG